jgi:hypothetical protein
MGEGVLLLAADDAEKDYSFLSPPGAGLPPPSPSVMSTTVAAMGSGIPMTGPHNAEVADRAAWNAAPTRHFSDEAGHLKNLLRRPDRAANQASPDGSKTALSRATGPAVPDLSDSPG